MQIHLLKYHKHFTPTKSSGRNADIDEPGPGSDRWQIGHIEINMGFFNSNTPNTTFPPYLPGSADNGLSVDPGTGHIVLGNDVGLTTATLLSNREIPTAGFGIDLTTNAANVHTLLRSTFIFTENTANNTSSIFGATGQAALQGDSTMLQVTPGITWTDVGAGAGTGSELRKNANVFSMGEQGLAGPGYFRQLSIDNQAHLYGFGEVDTFFSGTKMLMDANTGILDFRNTANTAKYSANGVPGITTAGAVPVALITVVGGIVTAIV